MPTSHDAAVIAWLLDSDPGLRWQVERDLLGAPEQVWQATRARVATEGWGAELLSRQDPDGRWAGGAYFPGDWNWDSDEPQPWTATTWALNDLRALGLDAAVLPGTAQRLATARWEYEDLPYWGGEVDVCINSWTLSNGLWLGADVNGLVDWFLEHQLADGAAPDPRLAEAVGILRSRRRADGGWPQEALLPGRTWLEPEAQVGEPSRWLTLQALRVLAWWDASA